MSAIWRQTASYPFLSAFEHLYVRRAADAGVSLPAVMISVKWHEKAPDHDDWLCDFKRSYQCYRYTLPDPTLYIYFAIHRGVSVLFEAHQLLYYLVEEKLTLRKISISRFVMCLKQKWERNASVYHTCYMYMYTPRCKMWLCVRRIRGRNTLIWQWDKALWKLFL